MEVARFIPRSLDVPLANTTRPALLTLDCAKARAGMGWIGFDAKGSKFCQLVQDWLAAEVLAASSLSLRHVDWRWLRAPNGTVRGEVGGGGGGIYQGDIYFHLHPPQPPCLHPRIHACPRSPVTCVAHPSSRIRRSSG